MKKHKLPKNWIVVNSQTHPERVYYFNVRTQQSSWTEPALDEVDPPLTKSAMARKGSVVEKDSSQSKPSTPEYVDSKDPQGRKKLRAKRRLQVVPTTENKEKETPEMKKMREKILQRQVKQQPKNVAKTPNVSTVPEDVANKTKQNTSPKNALPVKSATPPKSEKFTPQMQLIYNRMMQRKKSSTSRKSDISNTKTNVVPSDSVRVNRSRRTMSTLDKKSGTNSSTSSCSISARKATGHAESKQAKVVNANAVQNPISPNQKNEATTSTSPTSNKNRLQGTEKSLRTSNRRATLSKVNQSRLEKKNIAKERLDDLRRSLELENKDHIPVTKTPQSVYKNVHVRLQRLHSKVIKDYSSSGTNRTQSQKKRKSDDIILTSQNEAKTVENLVDECVESQYEEMDWEPMEDEKVMFEVQSVRNYLGTEQQHGARPNFAQIHTLDVPLRSHEEQQQKLYVIIDTNVLLSNIRAVEEVKDTAFKIYGRPIIVIPWTVIRELDYIKDKKSNAKSEALRSNARKAVRLLNGYFSVKHPRVVGQKYEDVVRNKEKYAVDCPDDEILQTCLQIREQNKAVVLLSYDKNLCNKAMIYDIVTIGRNDPIEKVDFLNAGENSLMNLHSPSFNTSGRLCLSTVEDELNVADEIYEDAKDVLKNFLSVIVVKEMQNLYNDNWEKYMIIRPPWTTFKVIKCALKHWIAAVSESFLRQAEPILKDLLEMISKQPDGGNRLDDVARMLEKCSDLIQMVHVDKYPDLMMRASKSIDDLKQKRFNHDIRIHEKRLREEIGYEDDVNEQERRAAKAFQYFEAVYAHARDIGGFAAEAIRMPCSFSYKIPEPEPNIDYVTRIQPEIAANVNRLLQSLSIAVKQASESCVDRRTLIALYHALTTFISDALTTAPTDFEPLDVYCCLKRKEEALKMGISQLQELSTHYCRLASFNST